MTQTSRNREHGWRVNSRISLLNNVHVFILYRYIRNNGNVLNKDIAGSGCLTNDLYRVEPTLCGSGNGFEAMRFTWYRVLSRGSCPFRLDISWLADILFPRASYSRTSPQHSSSCSSARHLSTAVTDRLTVQKFSKEGRKLKRRKEMATIDERKYHRRVRMT